MIYRFANGHRLLVFLDPEGFKYWLYGPHGLYVETRPIEHVTYRNTLE